MKFLLFAEYTVGVDLCDNRGGVNCEVVPNPWPHFIAYGIGLITALVIGITIYKWQKKRHHS